MSKKTLLPQANPTQTSGGKYQTFNHLNRIKQRNDEYAETEVVHGKNQSLNRPSTVTVHKFQSKLKTGAQIKKITVRYRHSKVAGTMGDKKISEIPAPSISLMNGNKVIKYNNKDRTKKGQAPTTTATTRQVTFTGSFDLNVINSNDFGVKLDYPTNTNDYDCKVRLYWIDIIIEYKVSEYAIKIKKTKGGYNKEQYTVAITVTNKNGTVYKPTVRIGSPAGFTFVRKSGGGTFRKKETRKFEWIPQFNGKKGSKTLTMVFDVDVIIPSGSPSVSGTFEVTESLNGVTKSHTAVIKPAREKHTDGSTDDDGTKYIDDDSEAPKTVIESVTVDKEFDYGFTLDEETWDNIIDDIYEWGIDNNKWSGTKEETLTTILNNFRVTFQGLKQQYLVTKLSKNNKIKWKFAIPHLQDAWLGDPYQVALSSFDNEDRQIDITLKAVSTGYDEIVLVISGGPAYYEYYNDEILNNVWKFNIKPATITPANMAILTLTKEETDRLGSGYPYIVQSFIKQVTSEDYSRDWDKNFRIGVFNNPIQENLSVIQIPNPESEQGYDEILIDTTDYNTLSNEDLFNYAEYWSNNLTNVNTYENMECQFVYNKEYPLYILITGDTPEGDQANNTIKYTEPCIVEMSVYEEREDNGIFPVPIDNINQDAISSLTIPVNETSNGVVLYSLPFEEDYGTDDTIAVRGIQLDGNIEATDDLVLYARLKSPTGGIGQRSVILGQFDTTIDSDNNFTIGGNGDLWQFGTLDLKDLNSWEIELQAYNSLTGDTAHLNFGDVTITFYIEEIEHQTVTCTVENENLSYYGAFLSDLEIPAGLKTDTDFLKVDGTDYNDPYRQNIKEKEIVATFDIGDNCDLEASTQTLRQLTKLLVNERDELNRPIPKRIEFSHYPDLYWEYIIKDDFDTEIEISSYKVKAKLVVPSGTAFKKESTTTGPIGFVQGLTNVHPIIQIEPTENTIAVIEKNTEQKFEMGYTGDWYNKIVEIDCEDRIVWLMENEDDEDPINLSSYVDFNSDWFVLLGEYEFEGINCAIRTIDYTERW